MERFKIISLILVSVSLISGCYSTSYRTEDKEANNDQLVIEKLNEAENRQLTLVFRDSLYTPEKDYLFKAYNIDLNLETKRQSNVLDASSAVADFTLSHTDLASKALARGNVVEAGLMVLGGGYLLDKLLTDNTPDIYSSGYYDVLEKSEYNTVDLSNQKAQETLESVHKVLNDIGYFMDVNKQTELPKIDTANPTLMSVYYQRENFDKTHEDTFWPRRIIVQTYFMPLTLNEMGEQVLAYSNPNTWQLNVYGSTRSLIDDAFENYRGFNRFSGSDLERYIFSNVSREVEGFHASHRGNSNLYYHVREGYYKGELYRFHEVLDPKAQLIEGKVLRYDEDNFFFSSFGR